MRKRAGITMSVWVWVIIGILMAAFVFASAQQNIIMLIVQLKNQQVVEQFNSIHLAAKNICAMPAGSRETMRISVNREVYAIYASKEAGPPDDDAPHYIESFNKTSGFFLCYQFNVENDYGTYTCKKLGCNVTMTYMGTPPKGSMLDRIARLSGESFNYKLDILKNARDSVLIDAAAELDKNI